MYNFLLLSMPDFTSPQTWMALITLTFLEIVLGIDNIIFISITANKLPKAEQPKARLIGLTLAMIFRLTLLLGISVLISLKAIIFEIDNQWMHVGVTGQAIILFVGGLFLLYKSTAEIHHKLEGAEEEMKIKAGTASSRMIGVIIQIGLVGLTSEVAIMMTAVVISVIIMMLFAGPVGRFVNNHPTIQMLGLAFLILIGFMLITEGAHLSHARIMGEEIGAVPKGYLYFAIAFSLGVEFLNSKLRKKAKDPVELRTYSEQAKDSGLLDKMS
jgi:predicted tellurium resistance membrane protein TerC